MKEKREGRKSKRKGNEKEEKKILKWSIELAKLWSVCIERDVFEKQLWSNEVINDIEWLWKYVLTIRLFKFF